MIQDALFAVNKRVRKKMVVYRFFHLYHENYLTPHLLCLVTMKFIKRFSEISISDVGLVGGKSASLGTALKFPMVLRLPPMPIGILLMLTG